MTPIIEVRDLVKQFGELKAVDGVSFSVDKGEIFGFLGPNGAGKSTTINILCTILKPSAGSVTLNGHDVTREQDAVRRSIGIVFQDPSLDDRLTAQENLEFHAMVYSVPKAERKKRIDRVLEMVDLSDRRNATVKTYSGGMKRRLEIARGLLHYPTVLFLDEPTIGLDPQTRNHIWEYIRQLRDEYEITIFLTTHYMDEAENCSRIAIIDHGKIVALDTPVALKQQVGGDVVTIDTADDEAAIALLRERFEIEGMNIDGKIQFEIKEGESFIPKLVAGLGMDISSIGLHHPTLDDVFIRKTGRAMRDETLDAAARWRAHGRRW